MVGACNVDLIVYVARPPLLGETLKGESFAQGFGGKGANQAVQAALARGGEGGGFPVLMLGKVGVDGFGSGTEDNFRSRGVDTSYLFRTDKASSGVAPITVSADGRNSIIIVGGANDLLEDAEVDAAVAGAPRYQIVMGQLEIPERVTLRAFRKLKPLGVRTILNLAPCPHEISAELAELLSLADIVCPNEVELAQITGCEIAPSDAACFLDQVRAAATVLRQKCAPGAVVISTIGAQGCMLSLPDGTHDHVKVPISLAADQVIDTSGAGDSFLGALATCLIELGFEDLNKAVKIAQLASALSVTKKGTQSSYPHRAELPMLSI